MPFFCAARSKFHDRSINNQTTTVIYTQAPQILDASERTIPATWLPMPTIDTADSRVAILNAVFPEHNTVAVQGVGAYTVDWGDGVVENFASSVVARHEYVYDNISADTDSGLGYRQVIIQMYPQAGNNLTNVSLNQYPTTDVLSAATTFLNLVVSCPTLTTLTMSSTAVKHPMLEQVDIQRSACTAFNFSTLTKLHTAVNLNSTAASMSLANAFSGCSSLVNLPSNWDTSNVTSMQNTFEGCHSLSGIPQLNTPNVTTCYRMFLNCATLNQLPVFDLPKCTRLDQMFQGCSNLVNGPMMNNTDKVTNFSSMFSGCEVLSVVYSMDMSAATTTASMFSNCAALCTIPDFVLPKVTAANSMFQGCTVLRNAPNITFGTSGVVVDINSMFSNCVSLESVPTYNTQLVTNFGNMFSSCRVLRQVGTYDFSSATTVSSMFGSCSQLENVQPYFDLPLATSIASMFSGCTKLKTAITMNIPSCTTVAGVVAGTQNLTDFHLTSCQSVLSTSNSTLDPTQKTAYGLRNFTMSGYRGNQNNGKIYLESSKLGKDALQALVDSFNFPGPYVNITNTRFTTLAGNVSTTRTVTGTENNPVLTTTLTTNLAVGMYAIQVKNTLASSAGTITWNGHTMQNGDWITVTSVSVIAGLPVGMYYVVNATTNTFQLSLTPGGTAVAFTGTGTMNIRYLTTVVSFVPNTSITLSRGVGTAVTNTALAFNSSRITAQALLNGTTIGSAA